MPTVEPASLADTLLVHAGAMHFEMESGMKWPET
jgi:hypothetical protein